MGDAIPEEAMERNKRELRARMKELRSNIGGAERASADSAITERFLAHDAYLRTDTLFAYLSFGNEVSTYGIIEAALADRKTVALPYCVPGTRLMRWYRVSDLEGLRRSPFGVLEPVPDPEREIEPTSEGTICLVPGLCFDVAGYRLGYGGGFYDTFLASFSGASFGLCREAQLLESLTAEGVIDTHDRPVRYVVTDAQLIG